MKLNTKDKNLSKQTRKACKSMRELRKNKPSKIYYSLTDWGYQK